MSDRNWHAAILVKMFDTIEEANAWANEELAKIDTYMSMRTIVTPSNKYIIQIVYRKYE